VCAGNGFYLVEKGGTAVERHKMGFICMTNEYRIGNAAVISDEAKQQRVDSLGIAHRQTDGVEFDIPVQNGSVAPAYGNNAECIVYICECACFGIIEIGL
jgi:hypothetical protein